MVTFSLYWPFLPMSSNWLPKMTTSSLYHLPSLLTVVWFGLVYVLRRVKDLTGPSDIHLRSSHLWPAEQDHCDVMAM